MNPKIALTVTSVLSILLFTFHFADDIVRGIEPGGVGNYNGVLILGVWLYATLMLGERRWAHVIVLVGSIGGAGVPYLHMMGSGLVGPGIVNSGGVLFFWVWTLLALGVTASVSVVLAARGLWSLRRRRPRSSNAADLPLW